MLKIFRTTAIFVPMLNEKENAWMKVVCISNIYYRTYFQDHTLNEPHIGPILQIHASAMFLLPIIENY